MENKPYELTDSVEALEAAIARVRAAQRQYATFTQEQVDRIFLAAATAADQARIPWRRWLWRRRAWALWKIR